MMSRTEAVKKKKNINDSDNGKLIHEIDTINKTLYSEQNPLRNSASSSTSTAIARGKSIGKADRFESNPNSKQQQRRRVVGGDGGSVIGEPTAKDKKSFWNWAKPLKALSQVRNRRFNCYFTLQVHTIEGLPSVFNGNSLFVHWKRRDGELIAGPAKVIQGIAEFQEQLAHTCSVHGSRSGANHSAKYEAKHFLLYASVHEQAGLDLGKHRVDLTRLLPLTFEELEDEKSSGKWTTTYKLQGNAAGALMNVSFGYRVLGDNLFLPPNNKNVLELLSVKKNNLTSVGSLIRGNDDGGNNMVGRSESLPKDKRPSATTRSVDVVKDLHEVVPAAKTNLSESLTILDEMLNPSDIDVSVDQSEPALSSFCRSDSYKENVVCGNSDLSSVEKLLESSIEETASCHEKTAVDDHSEVESLDMYVACGNIGTSLEGEPITSLQKSDNNTKESVIYDGSCVEKDICTKESILEEIEFALKDVADLENAGLDTPETKSESGDPENYVDGLSNSVEMSHSLEDFDSAESVFLNLLGVEDLSIDLTCEGEDEPESPRERLLREFERETENSGYSLFGFDLGEDEEEYEYNAPRVPEWDSLGENFEFHEEHYSADEVDTSDAFTISGWENFADDFPSPSVGEDYEPAVQVPGWRPRAKVWEDLETEDLMREWGLNEKAFQSSPPPDHTAAFVSIPEDPPMPPPLGEGMGPFVQTKNGGFLRSMSPALFRNSKSGGSLIMQVSSPVVVPAEMGSGVMEMLENLASLGSERLSAQANKLMPLEDITGKTMQQISWESAMPLETKDRQELVQPESEPGLVASGGQKKNKKRSSKSRSHTNMRNDDLGSDYVSLEDLAPLAMDKIEALSIEGLKIQSGMSEEEAPSSIRPKSLGVEGAVGLQLLDVKDNSSTVDGLMGMSLTLDEWMRLDSGEIDEDEIKNERTSKILAAHHASSTDLSFLGRKGDRRSTKGPSGRCGLFGNNFTVALMVQLRDPLRDYEPVGTPMLALIQVERVFVPPKMKIYSTVSDSKKNNDDEDDDNDDDETMKIPTVEKKEEKVPEEDLIPQYKVAEVHVAGLKAEIGKKSWGSANQQKSGSRWLLANGMGKANKQSFMKNKAVGKSGSQGTTIAQSGDTLWSISSQIHGTGAKWKELVALNPHIRNPNVIIPTGTVIRIR